MKKFVRKSRLMGCAFELGVVADDAAFAGKHLDAGVAEIQRIERIFTEYNSESVTSLVNHAAGIAPVTVTSEFLELIKRSIHISNLTNGYFDITAASLKDLYNFKNQSFTPPDPVIIKNQLAKIGYQKIIVSEKDSTVFLPSKGMKISFNAIGKGYAADMVMRQWRKEGVLSGYINASGDLNAFGKNENGEDWRIGITNPLQTDKGLFFIPIKNCAVATSGNYYQYFIADDRKYAHTIDPRTGFPVDGLTSVSIISPAAELSDALATAITAMGTKRGLQLVNQLPQTYAILIDKDQNYFMSENLYYETI